MISSEGAVTRQTILMVSIATDRSQRCGLIALKVVRKGAGLRRLVDLLTVPVNIPLHLLVMVDLSTICRTQLPWTICSTFVSSRSGSGSRIRRPPRRIWKRFTARKRNSNEEILCLVRKSEWPKDTRDIGRSIFRAR